MANGRKFKGVFPEFWDQLFNYLKIYNNNNNKISIMVEFRQFCVKIKI